MPPKILKSGQFTDLIKGSNGDFFTFRDKWYKPRSFEMPRPETFMETLCIDRITSNNNTGLREVINMTNFPMTLFNEKDSKGNVALKFVVERGIIDHLSTAILQILKSNKKEQIYLINLDDKAQDGKSLRDVIEKLIQDNIAESAHKSNFIQFLKLHKEQTLRYAQRQQTQEEISPSPPSVPSQNTPSALQSVAAPKAPQLLWETPPNYQQSSTSGETKKRSIVEIAEQDIRHPKKQQTQEEISPLPPPIPTEPQRQSLLEYIDNPRFIPKPPSTIGIEPGKQGQRLTGNLKEREK